MTSTDMSQQFIISTNYELRDQTRDAFAAMLTDYAEEQELFAEQNEDLMEVRHSGIKNMIDRTER
jgi:hypothetical protein